MTGLELKSFVWDAHLAGGDGLGKTPPKQQSKTGKETPATTVRPSGSEISQQLGRQAVQQLYQQQQQLKQQQQQQQQQLKQQQQQQQQGQSGGGSAVLFKTSDAMFRPYGHFPQQQQQQPTTAAGAAAATAEQPFHMASLLYPAGTTENHVTGASLSAAASSFARNMHVSIFQVSVSDPVFI
jgi:hypothetical protein